MKKLTYLLLLILLFTQVSGQQPHQAETFVFNTSNQILTGNQIYEAAEYIEFQEGSEYNPIQGESLEARINPYLLFPPPMGTIIGGPNPGDNGVVGSLAGNLDVSQLGSASYTIPLDIPDGVNGMKPTLMLQYSSLAGNGPMGTGWSLAGLSTISRTSTDLYNDGPDIGVNGIHFNQYDQFALDGQRLINISSNIPYGGDGAEYRTLIQSFSKVLSHGSAGNGPASFEVWTKDGKIIEYGTTSDSRIEAPGRSDVLCWLVSKIRDRQGNYISFEYIESEAMTYCPYRITYTGNDNTGVAISPFYSVEFTYEDRPDPYTQYIAGTHINTNKRLKKITVNYLPASTIYKEYLLTYSNDANTQINSISNYYSHLTSIEVNGTESSGTPVHLNPTVFEWGIQPVNYTQYSVLNSGSHEVIPGDFNGDGKTDIIQAFYAFENNRKIYSEWRLWLAKNDGTGLEQFPQVGYCGDGTMGFLSGDFNGDGLCDLLELYDNWWNEDPHDHLSLNYAFQDDECTFLGFFPVMSLQGCNLPLEYRFREGTQTGDFNGDGLCDLAVRCSHMSDNSQYGDEYDCKLLFSSYNPDSQIVTLNEIQTLSNINSFHVGHFFDKIKSDLIVLSGSTSSVYYWNPQQSIFSKRLPDFEYPQKYHTIFPADFNGDGLTDILTNVRTSDTDFLWEITESTGSGFWPWPTVIPSFLPNCSPGGYLERYSVFPSDYNGDGKSDIMVIDMNTDQLKFYFSKGKGEFILPPETYNLDVNYVSPKQFSFNDFNGDGIADILYYKDIFSPSTMLLCHPDDNSERLISVTNGLGKRDKITYTSLSTSGVPVYQKYFTSYLPSGSFIKDFQGPLYVVSKMEFDNGQGSFISREYHYEGACFIRLNAQFLGFSKIITTDNSTGITTTNSYNFTVKYDGTSPIRTFYFPYLKQSETFINQAKTGMIENVYKVYPYYSSLDMTNIKAKLIYPYLEKSNSQSWEIDGNIYNKTTRTLIEFDENSLSFGNPVKITTLSDESELSILDPDASFLFKSCDTRTYYPYDESNWVIANVHTATTETSIKDHGSQIRTKTFEYYPIGDSEGRSQLLWKETTEPGNDPKSLINEFDYYGNGNIKSEKLSAPNANPPLPDRQTSCFFDQSYQSRFITQTSDPLNQTTRTEYDHITEEITKKFDIDNQETKYTSNLFNTETESRLPDGTLSKKILRWVNGQPEAPSGSLFFSWEQTSGSSEVYTYYDKLGRVLRTVTKGFNGASVFADQQFDALGRPTKTSDPYFNGDTPLYTEKKYNTSYPRVDYIVFPDQSQISYSYQGLKVVTTDQSIHQSSKKQNAIGLIDESSDAKGKTVVHEYAYQSNNFVETITVAGNSSTQTVIRVDKFGNRTNITDPATGIIIEEYNAFGDLLTKQGPRQNAQNKTQYSYDIGGRMVSRIEDGIETTWTYLADSPGKGKISSVSNNNQTIHYLYDEFGRLKVRTEIMSDDVLKYQYRYRYDSYSRLLELTYPSGIKIRNHYKNNGFLWKITEADAGAVLLWEANHINAKEQLVQSTTGNIITSTFGYQSETGLLTSINAYTNDQILQDLEYSWDVSGNLTSRKKWIDRDSAVYLEETFEYDDLYRLTNIKLNNNSVCTSSYDDFGNVLQKTPLTQMQYGGTGASPYSLVSATCTGDAISHNEQNITYTLFDKISTIQEGDYQLNMMYGTDDERVKQDIQNGDDISTTIYLGGLCEKITKNGSARFLNYVNSPQGLIAIIVRGLTGPPEINYILTDHQGSYHCITDNAGNLVEELSFDAWGRRRNPGTWTFDNMPSTYLFDRGYTGHEHLDMFGLINMNGRAYDPVTGRFLSVDPFVQAPDFTQSYNRYTYCLNNPLKYTDPSGNEFTIGLAIAIGTVVNYAIQAWSGNINDVGDFFFSAGISAASSALSFSIGAGIMAVYAGSTFGAGFMGTQNALIAISTGYTSSFLSGAAIGGASGLAGGFVAGTGNALLQGQDFGEALWSGIKTGAISGASGALIGGILGGIQTIKNTYEANADNDGLLMLQGPEMSEKQVENAFKIQTGYGEGEYNIKDITTHSPTDAYIGKERLFVSNKDGHMFYGRCTQSFWSGKVSINISPYATKDIVFLRGVMTHEFRHVIQINTGVDKFLTYSQLERNANLHEILYYRSLPACMYEKHNILKMIQICNSGL